MLYFVEYIESGTNYRKRLGPFDSADAARTAANSNAYCPQPNSVYVYGYKATE
jgi:hypothetical protein